MPDLKISQLPEYTGNTSGSWLIMNNSGQTTTYKVKKENWVFPYNGNATITGSLIVSSSANNIIGGNATTLTGSNAILSTPSNVMDAIGGTGLNTLNAYRNEFYATQGNKIVGNTTLTGSLNVSGNISATTGAFATSITTFDSIVGGNLGVTNGYVRTPVILGQIGNTLTGTLDLLTLTRLSLTSSIGDVNISAGESGVSPKNIRLTSAGGTINSGSLRVIGNTTITGSLRVSDIPSGSTSNQYVVYNTGSGQFERTTNSGGSGLKTKSFNITGAGWTYPGSGSVRYRTLNFATPFSSTNFAGSCMFKYDNTSGFSSTDARYEIINSGSVNLILANVPLSSSIFNAIFIENGES